jgi:hypothetical protein
MPSHDLGKGIPVRKLMILPLAGLLAFSVVAPVAAAPNTSNTSGSGTSIYGEWSSDGTSGYASFGVDSTYGSFGEVPRINSAPGAKPGAAPCPDATGRRSG